MEGILEKITDCLKELLISGIMDNLGNVFDAVNKQVGDVATQVGITPSAFSPGVFSMIRNVSESVIVPIAGIILTIIACYELIQMINTVAKQFIQAKFIRPKERPYQTDNYYSALARQAQAEKEVMNIVLEYEKTKARPAGTGGKPAKGRTEKDRRRYPQR